MTEQEHVRLEEQIVQDAIANLGVHEDEGENHGKWVDVYLKFVDLRRGFPWCVAFAVYRAYAAAQKLDLKIRLLKTGSSSAIYGWFKKNDLLLAKPIPGCFGMLRGGPTGHCHTFIAVRTSADGVFVISVDGNEGNRVEYTKHRIDTCDFGRVD